jgi:alpha-mannosidase
MIHAVRWTAKKLAQRIDLITPRAHRRVAPIAPIRFHALPNPETAPPLAPGAVDATWAEILPNSHWGKRNQDFVMQSAFRVPDDWGSASPVALYLPLGEGGDFSHPEALVYIDGQPVAACDRNHQEVILPAALCDGREHHLALHGWTGLIPKYYPGGDPGLYLHPCGVVQIDQPTRDFTVAARVALGVVEQLHDDDPIKGALLNALDAAFLLLDLREPLGDAFYASIPEAHAKLRAGVDAAGAPLDVKIVATGHAHIDVAWLWTLGQTRRKAGRTFYTALRLMEQFPDYHFTQSQPQLYDYIRQDYPGLLDAIKERVAEGRWETIGGMWVEADCNLSGSESLARQFLLGRTFFREQFGRDAESPVLWLPDVFGYAWNLPQLIKAAGLEYFFTIKIGWSQYNRLPYDSFWWQGLDGTRVLTHFSTTPDDSAYASTYNAVASPRQAIGTWRNFQQKELQNELLMAFGWGDGGGGPTREMLENIQELHAFPGAPQMRQTSVAEFFSNLAADSGDRLPVWNGELYLELHRGTYTTQSRNKRANRKSEFLLHDAEFLASLAALLDKRFAYPHAALTGAWQLVCLNQFHDIIPGSSINAVYLESQAQYAQIGEQADEVRGSALDVVRRALAADLVAVNPTSFARRDPAFWGGTLPANTHLVRPDGGPVVSQPTQHGAWLDLGEITPYSAVGLKLVEGAPPSLPNRLHAAPDRLENDDLRVEINAAGDIVRIYDKRHAREVLPAGAVANQFQAFEDRPMNWDAWDVDIFYDDKQWLADPAESIRVVESGPLRATVEIVRTLLHSRYVQRISLAHDSARLDISTVIDWRERHVLLKVAFPVEVMAPKATFEIQWGNVERPTHRNTSWDWARFESCAQKWVDLSEGNYGVSLLNDCKYGHDIHENVMRISLLRSPTHPDPEADQGEHHFSYSLLPHAGSWDLESVAAAYALNDPLLVSGSVSGSVAGRDDNPASAQLCSVDGDHVVIETVKGAEDGNGLIVRLYECRRMRRDVTLTTGFTLTGAMRVNLLEEALPDTEQAGLVVQANRVTFAINPYEIVTLRLQLT